MQAIELRDYSGQDYVDVCFRSAAVLMSCDRHAVAMRGLYMLVNEYGATVDRSGTLARCVDRNPILISTLIGLGADRAMPTWDWLRDKWNTPLHRVAECHFMDVFEALVSGLSPSDLDLGDEHGCTALMTLMSEDIASEAYLSERFTWMMDRGVSCLPFDHMGQRVSQKPWGRRQPFKSAIAARIKDENWAKRRVFLFLRERGASVCDGLVMRVVGLAEFGIFKHVVGFL